MTELSGTTELADSDSCRSLHQQLADGSAEAWQQMVRLYGPLVDGWCRVAGIPEDAIADIAQDTFLSAFRSIHTYSPDHAGATFRGWLWRVCRSRIVDHWRRWQGPGAIGGSSATMLIGAVAEPVPIEQPTSPEDITRLIRRALHLAEGEVEPETWQIFCRNIVDGRPTDEVAQAFDRSTAAVRQIRSRILRRLRQILGDQ